MSTPALHIVLRCPARVGAKVRYVFDSLLLAIGVRALYAEKVPDVGPYLLYAAAPTKVDRVERCLFVPFSEQSWHFLEQADEVGAVESIDDLPVVLPHADLGYGGLRVPFDIAANVFYFLSSWSERRSKGRTSRQLHSQSTFARLGVPLNVVDRYLSCLSGQLKRLYERAGALGWDVGPWEEGIRYALVLSHDVDFVSGGLRDTLLQGGRTVLRHLVHQKDVFDAARAAVNFGTAVLRGQDPYSDLESVIRQEQALGVRSSFQVAVGHRHRSDVNYHIECAAVRQRLSSVLRYDFDLCLHGSYRSTDNIEWYVEEAKRLTYHLAKPIGSRQHYLSFDYDRLFTAQEMAGIEFDMSLGYPDAVGSRAGFSFPFFPYCIAEDRPYKVLEIPLALMDVTVRSYLGLKGQRAWELIRQTVGDVSEVRGCVSVVWHPIVFGGARDPGFDRLYWDLVKHVLATNGLPTDGRSVNAYWRRQAMSYATFAFQP
jgi:hypothetical protein